MSDYFDGFAYELVAPDGRRTAVCGLQIGYLAVRPTLPGETATHAGVSMFRLRYSLDHWPSGSCVLGWDDFNECVAIADDIARFCSPPQKLDAETVAEVVRQVGPAVCAWIGALVESRRFVPFRDWDAAMQRRAAA